MNLFDLALLLVAFMVGFVFGYWIGFSRGCWRAADVLGDHRPRSVAREPGRPPNSRSGGRP